MNLFLHLAKTARELAGTGSTPTEASKLCQKNQQDMTSDTDVVVYALRTKSVESLVVVGINEKDEEVMRFPGTAPAAVCPVTSIPNTDSSGARENIEPEPEEELKDGPEEKTEEELEEGLEDDPRGQFEKELEDESEEESGEELEDIFIQQTIIEAFDGQEHSIVGEIDTGNSAKFTLIGRPLVKELGLKEEPALGGDELRGIIGPCFRPTSFVRNLKFKLPRLGLGWVTVTVYVIDDDIGFILGKKAIRKFGLLSKLVELEKVGERLPKLRSRHISSAPASSVHTVIDVRSKARKKKEAKKHQENSHLAAGIASFREQWQSGADGCPSFYAPSIESSDVSAIATSTAVMSNASTWSTSTTCFSMESLEQKPKM